MNELYCFNYLYIPQYIYLYVRRRIFVLHNDNNDSQQIFKRFRKYESPVKKKVTLKTCYNLYNPGLCKKIWEIWEKLIIVLGAKSKNLANIKDAVLAKYR